MYIDGEGVRCNVNRCNDGCENGCESKGYYCSTHSVKHGTDNCVESKKGSSKNCKKGSSKNCKATTNKSRCRYISDRTDERCEYKKARGSIYCDKHDYESEDESEDESDSSSDEDSDESSSSSDYSSDYSSDEDSSSSDESSDEDSSSSDEDSRKKSKSKSTKSKKTKSNSTKKCGYVFKKGDSAGKKCGSGIRDSRRKYCSKHSK